MVYKPFRTARTSSEVLVFCLPIPRDFKFQFVEPKEANRGDLYNLIQSNTTAGNDFILFAAGGVAADATIAGKSVAVATYDANIAVVASTVNQSVGTDGMQKVTKPAAISENTNGNAIIGNEALMTITIN